MFLCRAAWHKLRPLAQKSITPLPKNAVPVRSMAYGLPGASAQNVAYAVLCGGSLTAALVYVYKTMISDGERFTNRLTEINARPKDPWESKPWPAKGGEDETAHSPPVAEEATEANEETSALAHTESLSAAADVAVIAGADVTAVAGTESTEVSAVAEVAESPGVAPEIEMLLASEVAAEALTEAVSEMAAEVVLATATEEPSMAEAAAVPIESNGTTPTQEAEALLVEVPPEETPEEIPRADAPIDVEA